MVSQPIEGGDRWGVEEIEMISTFIFTSGMYAMESRTQDQGSFGLRLFFQQQFLASFGLHSSPCCSSFLILPASYMMTTTNLLEAPRGQVSIGDLHHALKKKTMPISILDHNPFIEALVSVVCLAELLVEDNFV
jgi:hypothetical protein